MKTNPCLRLRRVGIFLLLVAPAAGSSRAVCYSTPQIAAEALVIRSSSSAGTKNDGYEVTRVESDLVLGRKWAIVSRCGHADWPVLAVPTNESAFAVAPATESVRIGPVVHAGDNVRLWKQESVLRFEVSGVAEETGGLGAIIRVRLAHKNNDGQSIPEEFSGVIRAQSDVEILP